MKREHWGNWDSDCKQQLPAALGMKRGPVDLSSDRRSSEQRGHDVVDSEYWKKPIIKTNYNWFVFEYERNDGGWQVKGCC